MLEIFNGNEQFDIALRLFSAVICGAAIGLNRFLRHKAAGMRTHALTSLGAAIATLIALQIGDSEAASRVMQGVLTGVGFIGAGVIMRNGESHVQGLTTAASIWVCAVIGMACGTNRIIIATFATLMTLAVLIFGRPVERGIARLVHDEKAANDKSD